MAAADDHRSNQAVPNGSSYKGKHPARSFEFFGPRLGPVAIMTILPLVTYGLFFACHGGGCLTLHPEFKLPSLPKSLRVFSWEAMAAYTGYIMFQCLLHLMIPGQIMKGTKLQGGQHLTYKLTGFRNLVVTMVVAATLWIWRPSALIWVHDQFLQLLTASLIFSFMLALYLYASSFVGHKQLAEEGSSGYMLYDFFMGRELNPRLGSLDLKEFCELYPGLTGWLVLNWGMMAHAAHNGTGITAPLLLVNLFQGIYVADALWFEPAILSTMDITKDGFGCMLALGDLSWVPFAYSLQARYLSDHPQVLSSSVIAAIVALKALGYLIFRGSNSQKDRFRRDPGHPANARLRTIETQTGRRLLVDGWWGVARHINYFGDLLMTLSWCLLCGFESIVPYFSIVYFTVLLVHRDRRDGHACHQKYGPDWERYTSLVKYRIVPLLY